MRIIRTDYSKLEELKRHLLGKAVTKAKARVNAMTKPLRQRIGEALFLSDELHSGFVSYHQKAMDEGMGNCCQICNHGVTTSY